MCALRTRSAQAACEPLECDGLPEAVDDRKLSQLNAWQPRKSRRDAVRGRSDVDGERAEIADVLRAFGTTVITSSVTFGDYPCRWRTCSASG